MHEEIIIQFENKDYKCTIFKSIKNEWIGYVNDVNGACSFDYSKEGLINRLKEALKILTK